MALQEQYVAYKFVGGIDTKTDEHAVPATRLLGLENGVFIRAGSIRKRYGYTAYSRAIDGSVSLVTGAKHLGVRDDELLAFTDSRCYSKQSGINQWTDLGAVLCPTGRARPAVTTGTMQTMPDHATNYGVRVYAWEDSAGGVWWTAVDAENGHVYRAPTQADADGQRPRCLAVGNLLHIYYAVPTQRRIMVLVVNPSTPSAAVTPAVLANDLYTTNPVYDACTTLRTGTPAAIAWQETATEIRIGYVDGGGALGSPASGHPSVARFTVTPVATSPLAVGHKYVDGSTGDYLFAAYVTGTDGTLKIYSGGSTTVAIGNSTSTATPYTPVTSVSRIALTEASGTVWTVFEEAAASASNRFCVANSVIIGGATGTARTLRSVGLASRGFQAGDDADTFAVFVHDTTYFNVYLTFRLSDFADAGRHIPGEAAGAPTRSHLSSVHMTDDVASFVLPAKMRLASTNNDKFGETALRLMTLNFDDPNTHQTAQLGRGLTLAGACPQHYDGRVWTEQGFHVGPELLPAPALAGGGSLTTASTYEYLVWYEWTDSLGEIHRGPTSVGLSVSTGGSTQATLTLPTLRVTRKANVRICVARSLPGDTSRHWRVTSLDPTTAGAANGYVANSTSSDTASFLDRMSDANLQLQERIYTTGGVLSNDPTSIGNVIAAGKNRIFATDASNGNIVRFSQRLEPGYGVEFAPELYHPVDPFGGDVTAVAVMDDVVYVFKASSIYAFNGDGPTESGGTVTQGFSAAQLITSDVGCTRPSSIVLTPIGLMFSSAKGIYLLDRSRNLSYAGALVEAYNTQTVRSADVMPDRRQILFLTDDGVSLLFDYEHGHWSTFTNHEGYDAAVVGDTYHYLRTDNTVFREAVGSYDDNGSRITLRIETAWLHLHEHLQGFQHFWKLLLLGTWYSPHQLRIQYRTDYNEAWSDPCWLDATGETSSTGWITGDGAATIGEDPIDGSVYGEGAYGDGPYGGSASDVYQWRYGIYEHGQSIQFRFEDYERAGLVGAGFELSEMTIVGGIEHVDMRPFSGARST